MPRLVCIAIYPIKSFDPAFVDEAVVLPSGALQHDRRFAVVDAAGKFINAKRTAAVHGLELELDPEQRMLRARLRSDVETICWNIDSQRDPLQRWLSDYFSLGVSLAEDTSGGFPDDRDAPGPTIVSTATLQTVAEWFPGLSLDDVRRRFRANLEIDGVEPFWEDHLYRADATAQPFRVGSVLFGGTNPCQRCVVPSRDPATGEVWPEFARRFAELRAAQLPQWAVRERFNHFYRLAVNTRLLDRGDGLICVGDAIEMTN